MTGTIEKFGSEIFHQLKAYGIIIHDSFSFLIFDELFWSIKQLGHNGLNVLDHV